MQLGGIELKALGIRAAPSLRYVQTVPPFSEHFFDNDDDDSKDQGLHDNPYVHYMRDRYQRPQWPLILLLLLRRCWHWHPTKLRSP